MSTSVEMLSIANRASRMLSELSGVIREQRVEFEQDIFYLVYSKASVAKLPGLTRAIVEKAMSEMESAGYVFKKRKAGNSEKYALTIENIVDIYAHRGFPKYKSKHEKAFTIFVTNLKGGVSKTVSTVSLAHALRTHPHLIQEDLKILVVDLDPQSSATMFLNHECSIGNVDSTAAQAMLQNISTEELMNEFVVPSIVNGVDVIPASIEDAFIASKWDELCREHLSDQNKFKILKENIIERLSDHYDFIFLDSGPHLDSFLMNSLASADLLMTPIPPAQVDFHSTLKYLTRLPELEALLLEEGVRVEIKGNIGFMSKIANKADHKYCLSLARDIFGRDMLDSSLPRLDGFERCGESFDTVISANPTTYVGSNEALKKAKEAAELFAKSVFDRIELIRGSYR